MRNIFSVLELSLNLLDVCQFYGSALVPGLSALWQLTSLCLSVCFAQRSRCRKATSDLWRLISEVKCSHSRRRHIFTPAAFQSERVDRRPGGRVEPVGPVSCRESNPRPVSRSWRSSVLLKVSVSVPQLLSWNYKQPLWQKVIWFCWFFWRLAECLDVPEQTGSFYICSVSVSRLDFRESSAENWRVTSVVLWVSARWTPPSPHQW